MSSRLSIFRQLSLLGMTSACACTGFAEDAGKAQSVPAPKPAATTAPAKPASDKNPPTATAAPADFPFNFQSVFGSGDKAMAGLREKTSGKSRWVSKGEKIGDYTLEFVDSAKGIAVLSRKGVRYQLRLSLSTNTGVVAAKVKVDPVENARKEKVLINDARQLSSALQQYCSENAVREAPLGEVRKFFSGNTLSPGTQIALADGRFVDFSDKSIDTMVVRLGEKFSLRSDGYDKAASQNRSILPEGKDAKDTPGGESAITFSADDAQPAK